MSEGSILVRELETMLKDWKFVSVDAKGNLGAYYWGGDTVSFTYLMHGHCVQVCVLRFTLLSSKWIYVL